MELEHSNANAQATPAYRSSQIVRKRQERLTHSNEFSITPEASPLDDPQDI